MVSYVDSLYKLENISLQNIIGNGCEPTADNFNKPTDFEGGSYSLDKNGNLILEQPCQLNNKIWLLRNYFKIQDRQTLIREKCQFVSNDSIISFDSVAVFHFVPAQNKPDPLLNHAKRKKYMWRSKKEWKEYKVARKEYYRRLKNEAKQIDLESK